MGPKLKAGQAQDNLVCRHSHAEKLEDPGHSDEARLGFEGS